MRVSIPLGYVGSWVLEKSGRGKLNKRLALSVFILLGLKEKKG